MELYELGGSTADALPPLAGEPRPRTVPWAGAALLAGGVLAAVCLAVGPRSLPGQGRLGYFLDGWSVYTPAQGLLAAAVIGCGIAAIAAGRRVVLVALAAGAVFVAQLSAAGVVAFKHWVPWSGMGPALHSPELLKTVAVVLAVGCLAAVVACVLGLIAADAFTRAATSAILRVATVAIGVVIVGLMPLALAGGYPDLLDWESQGAFVLLYGAPWGIAVAVSAWLRRPAALGANTAVLVSAVIALSTDGIMSTSDQPLGFGFAALAAASVAVTRLPARRRPAATPVP